MTHMWKMASLVLAAPVIAALAGNVAKAQTQTNSTLVEGIIQKLDAASKTMTVKTKEGTEQVVAWTDKTINYGAQQVKEGANVVVQTSDEAGKKVAQQTKVIGTKATEFTQGTITKVDQTAKTVTVRVADGSQQVYNLAKDGVIQVAADGKAAGEATGQSLKEGMQVVVRHTTESGQKIAHVINESK